MSDSTLHRGLSNELVLGASVWSCSTCTVAGSGSAVITKQGSAHDYAH